MNSRVFLQLFYNNEIIVEVELPESGQGGFLLELKGKKLVSFNHIQDETVLVNCLSDNQVVLLNDQPLDQPQPIIDGDILKIRSREYIIGLYALDDEDNDDPAGATSITGETAPSTTHEPVVKSIHQSAEELELPFAEFASEQQTKPSSTTPPDDHPTAPTEDANGATHSSGQQPQQRKLSWLIAVLMIVAAVAIWQQWQPLREFVLRMLDSDSSHETVANEPQPAESSTAKPALPQFKTTFNPEPPPIAFDPPPEQANESSASDSSPANPQLELLWRQDLGSPVGCLSASGDLLAAGTADGKIHLITISELQVTGVLSLHTDSISQLVLSPDAKLLLAASYDGNVSLWNVPDREPKLILGAHPLAVRTIDMTDDGRFALTADIEGLIIYWDLETGEDIRFLLGHTAIVSDIKFSADGTKAVSAGSDGLLIYWDLATGEKLLELDHQNVSINAVDFSPDGKFLALVSDNFTAQPGQLVPTDLPTLQLIELESGSPVERFSPTNEWLLDVEYSTDGNLLAAAAAGDPGFNNSDLDFVPGIIVWHAESGQILATAQEQTQIVNGVTFLRSSLLSATSLDHTIRIWQLTGYSE